MSMVMGQFCFISFLIQGITLILLQNTIRLIFRERKKWKNTNPKFLLLPLRQNSFVLLLLRDLSTPLLASWRLIYSFRTGPTF